MSQEFVFVYLKNKKYKVIGLLDARIQHDSLILDGYKHISTLLASQTIESLFNSKNVIEFVSNLKSDN